MIAPFKVIQKLEAESSRLAKEAIILAEAKVSNSELFNGARLAYDAMITFGVKKVPLAKKDGAGLAWNDFFDLACQLNDRKLTGHAARDAIEAAMKTATVEQWNDWYRRILLKDLKCGASEKTFNTVCEKDYPLYVIPVFSCQLAHDGAEHEDKMVGKKLIEVKLDGMRVLTVVYPSGQVAQFSRNGKELLNFEKICGQFAQIAPKLAQPTVFDGEVMSASFQDLMKQAKRKTDVSTDDAVLHLFDIIPLEDFMMGECLTSQAERSELLVNWFAENEDVLENVEVVGQELVDLDTEEGQERYKQINKKALELKYEGVMAKEPDAIYQCKRVHAWLKAKPFIEVSLTVVGYEEGKPDTKNVGRLGALLCEGEDDGKVIFVSCGGGFSDKQRAEIWASLTQKPVTWTSKVKGKMIVHTAVPGKVEDIMGQVVEVRGDALTISQDSEVWSIRFPRFRRFRGFTAGEKL